MTMWSILKLSLGASAFLCSLVQVKAGQAPLFTSNKYDAYDAGLFRPLGDLSVLSEDRFMTMTHPVYPRHSVRIKKSSICDTTVNAYSGYIDFGARHLFFQFFESRNDPDKDDVIFWTNGGPGCASSLGLYMELGPCRVLDSDGPKYHPHAWNSNANIFFVDQPIGVGFSYAEYDEAVGTTEEAAKDIAAFVAIFFQNFPKFQGRGFHMAGESYAGRYIPLFAAEVSDQNERLVEAGLAPVNLTSIIIGNGMTDPYSMATSYYDMVCTGATIPPILDIASCVRMRQALPRCKRWLRESCVDTFDAINCNAAAAFCEVEFGVPFFETGRNPYNIAIPCEGKLEETLCYPVTKFIAKYLDQPDVRLALGTDPAVSGNYSGCSNKVGYAFVSAQDLLHSSYDYVASLLERGVQALIYVGKNDWICNHVGNERWTTDLEWTGGDKFRKQELKPWIVDGKRAGDWRSANGLVFATVLDAGHMVPYDKPVESLAMINRWLAKRSLE